jgi:hypothetical protein
MQETADSQGQTTAYSVKELNVKNNAQKYVLRLTGRLAFNTNEYVAGLTLPPSLA